MASTLHIQLLGDFLLLSGGTYVSTVNTPRMQSLLAYLVLHRKAPQSRYHLAFLLWPDLSEAQAKANLRKILHYLRQALPQVDALLRVDSKTLHWLPNPAPDADPQFTLDVDNFESILAQANQREQAGHHSAARIALQEAVDLYRGDLLPTCYDDWILPQRELLHQAFMGALEQLLLMLERAHDYSAAIVYTQQLLQCEPLREATYQHLMRLHTTINDRTGALRIYRSFAALLERELGATPSEATQEIYRRLLTSVEGEARDEEALSKDRTHGSALNTSYAPTLTLIPPRLPARTSTPTNLPAQPTVFIGRQKEIVVARNILSQTGCRLLTLVGPPGIGKTRLGVEVANGLIEDFADGVFLTALAPISDPSLVASAIARSLGIREVGEQPIVESLKQYLRDRQILLVLDNFEHLLDAGLLVAELMSSASRLKVLVTSREVLHLRGEKQLEVPALSLPCSDHQLDIKTLTDYEAVWLFVERATDVKDNFALSPENGSAVVEICRRLDGLPLAIELAAVQIKKLSPQELLDRLGNRLELLTGGARDLIAYQQTLRSAIAWSYDLLDDGEQKLFRRLGVFTGGCTLKAAEAVCNLTENLDLLDGMQSLVDKSLLRKEDWVDRESRFWMLETIREYALERLGESGERETTQQLHCDYYLRLAEMAEPELIGPDQAGWLTQLEGEHNNLRAALRSTREKGQTGNREALEMGLRLAGALWQFWHMRGFLNEGREQLDGVLSIRPVGLVQGGVKPGRTTRAKVLNGAGVLAFRQGDFISARSLLEESLMIWRELEDGPGIASSLLDLGRVIDDQGDYATAVSLYEESLVIRRELGDNAGIAWSLANLGNLARMQGDYATSRPLYEESLVLFRELGDMGRMAIVLNDLGAVATEQGDFVTARSLLEESLAIRRELGDKWGIASSLYYLGSMAYIQGDHTTARSQYKESLAIRRELGDKWGIVRSLDRLARVERSQNMGERAAHLWGAAEVLRDLIGSPVPPGERSRYDQEVAAACAQLGEEALAKAWAEGRAMSIEQAIAYALEVQL